MNQRSRRPGLPPLNALRAFESVARLGSFTSAADELCVTPAAVSQQIKSLEGWVGLPLFVRHAQGVSLTDTGRQAGPALTQAFDIMGETVRSMIRTAKPLTITIATLPSVAQFWLSPRLSMLRNLVPGLKISVTTRLTPPNLNREPFDFCLFLENPKDDDDCLVLTQDEIFPVCAPEVARNLKSPSDLSHETLLSDETWLYDWETWIKHTGADIRPGATGPVFSLFGLALDEAINGAGVLIGHSILVEDHLKRNLLVAPFPDRVGSDQKLCLRVGKRHTRDPIISEIVQTLVRSCQ